MDSKICQSSRHVVDLGTGELENHDAKQMNKWENWIPGEGQFHFHHTIQSRARPHQVLRVQFSCTCIYSITSSLLVSSVEAPSTFTETVLMFLSNLQAHHPLLYDGASLV